MSCTYYQSENLMHCVDLIPPTNVTSYVTRLIIEFVNTVCNPSAVATIPPSIEWVNINQCCPGGSVCSGSVPRRCPFFSCYTNPSHPSHPPHPSHLSLPSHPSHPTSTTSTTNDYDILTLALVIAGAIVLVVSALGTLGGYAIKTRRRSAEGRRERPLYPSSAGGCAPSRDPPATHPPATSSLVIVEMDTITESTAGLCPAELSASLSSIPTHASARRSLTDSNLQCDRTFLLTFLEHLRTTNATSTNPDPDLLTTLTSLINEATNTEEPPDAQQLLTKLTEFKHPLTSTPLNLSLIA